MNSCNCNRIIRPTAYTVAATFNIETDYIDNDIRNGKRYILVLDKDLPSMTTIVPVYLEVNGTLYPMQDVLGNNLMSDQLRSFPRTWSNCSCKNSGVVRIIFGSNPGHFKVLVCLPNSSAIITQEDNQ